jgi:hypothetical protein
MRPTMVNRFRWVSISVIFITFGLFFACDENALVFFNPPTDDAIESQDSSIDNSSSEESDISLNTTGNSAAEPPGMPLNGYRSLFLEVFL